MVRIKNVYHSTSIADFISTRYNNSHALAALISILCLVGITPYISIQLKSIITTFTLLVDNNSAEAQVILPWLDMIIVLMMAAFTIAFGVKRLDPTEKHPGMMVALAAESLFKLLVFICSALLICFVIFGGFSDIIAQIDAENIAQGTLSSFSQPPPISAWFTSMILGVIGIIALPRQFHVTVVECSNEKFLDKAKWQFPLYLLLVNLMVLPLAMAGQLIGTQGGSTDLLLLNIPITEGHSVIATLVFLGGFAASTAMIMVSTMTLSTMGTNHLVLPLIERFSVLHFLRRHLLYVKWAVVVSLLLLSLFYFRRIGESEVIVKIGSISFVAMAQLLPALVGGMLWKNGTLRGAFSAIFIGMLVWFYTSMLPSVIRSGWIDTDILQTGLFQLAWLKPEQLLGSNIDTPIGHSLFWSLFINTCVYILMSSLNNNARKDELKHNQEFLNVGLGQSYEAKSLSTSLVSNIALNEKLNKIDVLLAEYLPLTERKNKINLCITRAKLNNNTKINILELAQLKAQATSVLAGIIGMASANNAMKSIELLNDNEQALLSTCYSELLAKANLSPDELLEKVDFYQEKQSLLENHAEQQQHIIQELQCEKEQTSQARQALKSLNEELELRVDDRTKQLTQANTDLTTAMSALKNTQTQLVEAEKMASLGGLVAGVSHEINTPIGIVLTAISSLQSETARITELYHENKITKKNMDHYLHYADEACKISENNIRRAADLVTSFKQVAVDQTHEEQREFLVKDYIEDILLSLRPTLRKTQLSIDLVCDDTLTINSFPGAFSQIISNFIFNSHIHAYEPNQAGKISITVEKSNQTIVFKYSDDGKGVSAEGKQNIFEPFYTTKRGIGGTGLGAHIIYNIVSQQLKGEIVIDESITQGLGFIITIPLHPSIN
ncbi:hypothetical protein GCM10009111_08110 [Colwellia asteriadis]|uniref:histidine kinase n=2 Tax=Colwelliaceae TaxID=267889 RepID=A0ABN1L486_9GAMM